MAEAAPSAVPTPSRVIISDQNEGPIITIATWLGFTFVVFFVFTRIGSKWSVIRHLTPDDGVICVTMILALCHTVMLSMMVTNGLGRPQNTLDNETIQNYEKFGYASQLIYIPALCLAKLSTLVYLRGLSPRSSFAFVNKIIEASVLLWGVSAEFAIAFQCNVPNPWASITSKCFDRVLFWNIEGALDIITDLAIVVLPAYLVMNLQMPFSKKALVFSIFGTRILIIPLTIYRIYVINTNGSPNIADQTLSSYHTYLATTVQLNFAIFAACIPFLKPFMERLSSGVFEVTLNPTLVSNVYGANSRMNTVLSTFSSKKVADHQSIKLNSSTNTSITRSHLDISNSSKSTNWYDKSPSIEVEDFHFGLDNNSSENLKLRPERITNFSHVRRSTPEELSDKSSISSDKMIIKRTTEWQVQEVYDVSREDTSVGASKNIKMGEGTWHHDWSDKGSRVV